MTSTPALRRTLPALCIAGGFLLAACSGSVSVGDTANVDSGEVEAQAAAQLAEQVGAEELPTIDCTDDLEAKVGATLTCELTAGADPAVYAVEIEVTSIDEETDEVLFDIQVSDEPLGE